MHRFVPLALPLAMLGCRPPPEAPGELEELTSWLYARVDTGTDEEMEVGLGNLVTWLDGRFDEATAGYTVNNLSEEIAHSADGRSGPLEGLVGASVATRVDASFNEVTDAMLLHDQSEVFEGTYVSFEREYDGDMRCFASGQCPTESATTRSVNNYPLGLEVSVEDYVASEGLEQVSDIDALEPLIQGIIDANPKQADDLKAGKGKLMGFFVGQVMKETSGQANPQQVNTIIRSLLDL